MQIAEIDRPVVTRRQLGDEQTDGVRSTVDRGNTRHAASLDNADQPAPLLLVVDTVVVVVVVVGEVQVAGDGFGVLAEVEGEVELDGDVAVTVTVGHGGSVVVAGGFDDEVEFDGGKELDGAGELGPGEGGTGGGGTETGGGAAAAFGAPIGTLLSGVGSTPVR
jgi:hypothetical protein